MILLWVDATRSLVWHDYGFQLVDGLLAFNVHYGPWFWVHTITAYTTVAAGSVAIVLHHFRARKLYRRQTITLLVGSLLPIALNLVYVVRLFPGLKKDYTPISFALAGLAFAVGIFRNRLFDIRPIARATLVDSIADPVITLDAVDRITDLNPAAARLLADLPLDVSGDELLGRDAGEVLAAWPALTDHLQHGTMGDIVLGLAGDEDTRHYGCRITWLTDARDHHIGRLILLQDITERKRSEDELRRQMVELEISNEQLDAFAYSAAHDLKGPLSTMRGFVEMIDYYLDALTKDEIRAYLVSLRATSKRMEEIIDSLLLLARIHRQDDLDVTTIEMGMVVREAMDRVASLVMETGAEVTTTQTWPLVSGYAPWITEVWVNYLTNAIKYGGDPPRITVGVEPADPRRYRFWIRDNGSGLTPEQTAKLYRPFTRFHAKPAGGHGLGLSIVHRIIDRLGGEVGVQSEIDAGSTFWFTLPAAPKAVEPPPDAAG